MAASKKPTARTKTKTARSASKKPVALFLPFSPFIFGSDYYIALMLGMVVPLHKNGYEIRFSMVPTTNRKAWDELLVHDGIGGALVVGDLIPEAFIRKLMDKNIPIVLINNRLSKGQVSYVCCDNFNSAYDAVTYLASIGHKRIGMLKGLPKAMDASDRFEGYKEALAENGLPFDEELVFDGDFTEVGGFRAIKEMLARLGKNIPSAIFCANDDMAIGALTAIRESGLRCPEDIALVGFDNIRLSAYVNPPLTTVRQPVIEMGTQASIMLTELIEGKKKAPQISILPTELIIRKSCGVDF